MAGTSRKAVLKELKTLVNVGDVMAGYLFDAGIYSVDAFMSTDLPELYLRIEEIAGPVIVKPHFRALVGAKHGYAFGEVPEALMDDFPGGDIAWDDEAQAIQDIAKLKNLGPKSAEKIVAVGVSSVDDFLASDPHEIFARLKEADPRASKNYLKAMIGAQRGISWQQVSV